MAYETMAAAASAVSQLSTSVRLYCPSAARWEVASCPSSTSSERLLPRARNSASKNEQTSSQGEISASMQAAPATARSTNPAATVMTSSKKTCLSQKL